MKFGSLTLSELPQVAWDLPEDASATRKLFDKLPTCSQEHRKVYVGCSVWTDKSFLGKIYPKGTAVKDFLKAYCRQFNAVELNATFYHIPSIELVKKWRDATKPGFQFCPKIPRAISHGRDLSTQMRLLDTFTETMLHLEETLGVAFMQLPPYCRPGDMPTLQQLLMNIPQEFKMAVELRHAAWFEDELALQELFSFLRERGMVAVITDVAGRRDVLHQTLTSGSTFVRFVGNNLHPTDYARIDAWVSRLAQWFEQGLQSLYFFLHEPQKALCADLAMYMIQRLNVLAGTRVILPKMMANQTTLSLS